MHADYVQPNFVYILYSRNIYRPLGHTDTPAVGYPTFLSFHLILSLCPDIFSVLHRKSRAYLFQFFSSLASEPPGPHRTDISFTDLARIHSLPITPCQQIAFCNLRHVKYSTYSLTQVQEAKTNLKIDQKVITKTENCRSIWTCRMSGQNPSRQSIRDSGSARIKGEMMAYTGTARCRPWQ